MYRLSILAVVTALLCRYSQAAMNEPYRDILNGRNLSGAPGMTWKGPLFEGGENYTLTGTLEEIYKQAVAINPEQAVPKGFQAPNTTLAKRAQTGGCCNCLPEPGFGWYANTQTLSGQVGWLLAGGAGGACVTGDSGIARVACNNGPNFRDGSLFLTSAISLVNNRPANAEAPCNVIGQYAAEILQNCRTSFVGDGITYDMVWPSQICTDYGWCVYVDGNNGNQC